MNVLKKKHVIKILTNTEVFYCKNKKIIILKRKERQKSLKIPTLLTIDYTSYSLTIKIDSCKRFSNHERKKAQSLIQTTVSLIKQLLIEIISPIYEKLKLVGVGYKIFPVEGFERHLLMLRLGYSHPIYFRIPTTTDMFCLKLTKLFVFGYSYQQITSVASKIRLNKVPEPYKGKGILYENEIIVLKEGKKV